MTERHKDIYEVRPRGKREIQKWDFRKSDTKTCANKNETQFAILVTLTIQYGCNYPWFLSIVLGFWKSLVSWVSIFYQLCVYLFVFWLPYPSITMCWWYVCCLCIIHVKTRMKITKCIQGK